MTDTEQGTVPFIKSEDIERRARDVLRSHGLETIPVDPVSLANREGITVNNAKFSDDNLVGMLVKRGDDITMLVNHNDPPFRKRFTIAHELGHHFLHLLSDGEYMDREVNLFRSQASEGEVMTPEWRREIQANRFAAALLMPEDHVRRVWMELHSVEEMARLFNVSVASMGIRIGQLGLG